MNMNFKAATMTGSKRTLGKFVFKLHNCSLLHIGCTIVLSCFSCSAAPEFVLNRFADQYSGDNKINNHLRFFSYPIFGNGYRGPLSLPQSFRVPNNEISNNENKKYDNEYDNEQKIDSYMKRQENLTFQKLDGSRTAFRPEAHHKMSDYYFLSNEKRTKDLLIANSNLPLSTVENEAKTWRRPKLSTLVDAYFKPSLTRRRTRTTDTSVADTEKKSARGFQRTGGMILLG